MLENVLARWLLGIKLWNCLYRKAEWMEDSNSWLFAECKQLRYPLH